jgi:signal transduction histidine kinase
MMDNALPDAGSLAVFAFGALTFSTLAALYWGSQRRRKPGASTALPAFTLVCAVAFLNSIAFRFTIVSSLTAGLLPALILHLVFEMESARLPRRRAWRFIVTAFYACAVPTLLEGLNDTGLIQFSFAEGFYSFPALSLAAASVAGLALLACARRPAEAPARAHRRWTAALLLLLLACAGASLSGFGAAAGSLPDYLLLLFFCVTLYYRERLVFFDVLVKRGVFLAVGLAILTLAPLTSAHFPLVLAGGFLVCWLTAPWIYDRLARMIDRVWLRRAWSPAEAERRFLSQIQIAATEDELRRESTAALGSIFSAPAEVHFDAPAPAGAARSADDSLTAILQCSHARLGQVRLLARPNGIPYLSDDRRLLESLARALGVLVENVRFREDRRRQEERERDLRWLASRAELKALRAQINPHFLFNALSVIAGLMHYQPELADETIGQLAQVFRYTLRKSESEWAPLWEEVEFVTAYLRIEQARFGERLRLQFDVDPSAAHVQIPAMSIQPLIENAIKHGVSAVEGCGTVGLRVMGPEGAPEHGSNCALRVEVLDNGPGFPAGFSLDSAGNGHGLRNVAERLRGYYGDEAKLSWESGPQGTLVAFTIPQLAAAGVRGVSA